MFLSLVFHNHQPVGQLPWAFEQVWRESYQPFLDVLEAHPRIEVALHYTGPLLDWLQAERPQTIAQLQRLVARRQVEIIGGGFYEPILAVWPRQDQDAQIQTLSARVEQLFGARPRGLWLAERIWEPSLAQVIAANNLDYTFVDNTVFEAAGLAPQSTLKLFRTSGDTSSEDAQIGVFPINGRLRELIPWHAPAETIGYLQGASSDPNALAVFADDGEKFGAWPGTHDFIFTRGWLEDFFCTLENSPQVQLITPRKYFDQARETNIETIALPSGSYAEMMDWSGGNWRHFLDRYAESHDMWQAVSNAGERVRSELAKKRPATEVRAAYDHVLRAQSNDAYWHGTFGGLYLRHLRQSIYHHIAAAKVLCNPAQPFARATKYDDGTVEVQNAHQSTLCRARGGALFNWTSLTARHNLLSTLRRHHERYHDEGAPVDWYGRGALLDHFFSDDTSPEDFANARYGEQGDFISEPWSLEIENPKDGAALVATRHGGVWVGAEFLPLRICKRVALSARFDAEHEDALDISYQFFNPGVRELNVWWAHEWNLALSAWNLPERHYHADDHQAKLALDQAAQFPAVQNPIVADRWLKCWVEWQWPQPMAMWHVPLWTHSQKEGGDIEKSYQQSSFVWHRQLKIAPQEHFNCDFRVVLTAKP